jgi:hypothetical protein
LKRCTSLILEKRRERRLDGTKENEFENRRYKRFDFLSGIEYILDPPVSKELHKAVAVNISEKGMAVYVYRPYLEGQQIIIKSALPITSRIATVRWIKQEDKQFYLVGLHFNDHFENA